MSSPQESGRSKGLCTSRHLCQSPSGRGHLTLNQRVQGSSPCTPTCRIKDLAPLRYGPASQKDGLGSIWEAHLAWGLQYDVKCPPFRPDTWRKQEGSRISLRISLC